MPPTKAGQAEPSLQGSRGRSPSSPPAGGETLYRLRAPLGVNCIADARGGSPAIEGFPLSTATRLIFKTSQCDVLNTTNFILFKTVHRTVLKSKMLGLKGERPLLQGVPLLKTSLRLVFNSPLCGAPNDKDFALCGGRPKGFSPFGNLASAAALDQLYKPNVTMLLR